VKPARLTEGPLTSQLVRLAWPVFISRGLHTLYGVAATAWVGRISPEALAGVSTGFFASWTIAALGDVLVAGVTARVSQAVGARRDRDAARVASAGAATAILAGIVIAGIGFFGARPLFALLFDNPEIERAGSTYLSLYALLAPVFYLVFVFESVFRSCGNSRTPMFVAGTGSILNLILDPCLILGWGPFPRLEIHGAVLSIAISHCLVLSIYLILVARQRFPLHLPVRAFPRERFAGDARSILRIGSPQAVTGMLYSAVYLFLSRITGRFGSGSLAALGVVNRLESLNYLSSVAMGMAVAAMVGQNLGGNRRDRAVHAAHRGAAMITILTATMTVIYLVMPEPIVRIFVSDPKAVAEGTEFLRIVALSQIFMGWEIVYGGAFMGSGNTVPPMKTALVTSLVRFPLAWGLALPLGLGSTGVWWTITLTCIARGLWVTAWFRRAAPRFSVAGAAAPDETRSSGEIPLSRMPVSPESSPDLHVG
jgi:putative MATE family efflux protein